MCNSEDGARPAPRLRLLCWGSEGATTASRGGGYGRQRDWTGHRHQGQGLRDVIWFTEACLSNALRLEIYIQDAEREGDTELATFFRKAQAESRKGAEQGKELLRKRLGR